MCACQLGILGNLVLCRLLSCRHGVDTVLKVANFSHPVYLTPPLKEFPLELGIAQGVTKAPMIVLTEGRNSFKIG